MIVAIASGKGGTGKTTVEVNLAYDASVTKAQVAGLTVVEFGGVAADDIRVLWERVQRWMEE